MNRTDQDFLAASLNAVTGQERLKYLLYRWWAYVGSAVCALLLGLLVWLKVQRGQTEAALKIKLEAQQQASLYASAWRGQTKTAWNALQKININWRSQRPIQPGLSVGGPSPKNVKLLPQLDAALIAAAIGSSAEGVSVAATLFLWRRTSLKPPGAGVITAFVRERTPPEAQGADPPNARIYLLTVPAILGDQPPEKGLKLYQPSLQDSYADRENNQIAHVSAWITPEVGAPNRATGMIAELVPDIAQKPEKQWNPDFYLFGKITGTTEADVGLRVFMIGRSSVRNVGSVRSRARVTVKDPDNGRAIEFEDLIEITGDGGTAFSQPGDNGAPVFTTKGMLVGLVIARRGQSTYAVPIGPVLDKLNVELITSPLPVSPPAKGG